jgi:hypothetical protein
MNPRTYVADLLEAVEGIIAADSDPSDIDRIAAAEALGWDFHESRCACRRKDGE